MAYSFRCSWLVRHCGIAKHAIVVVCVVSKYTHILTTDSVPAAAKATTRSVSVLLYIGLRGSHAFTGKMGDTMRPPAREPPTPRTNADFRALLETPRANRGGETPSRGQQKSGAQKKKPSRPKPKVEKEEADEGPLYRDRAEERRKGLNPDYERTAMSGLPTDAPLNPTMSVEETKYLGGDLEHTHLVKGLDYALLQKV